MMLADLNLANRADIYPNDKGNLVSIAIGDRCRGPAWAGLALKLLLRQRNYT